MGAVCASVLVLVLLVGGMIGLASNGSSNSYAGYGDTTSSTSSSIDSSVTRYGCSLATLTNDTCTIRHLIAAYCNTKVGNVNPNYTTHTGNAQGMYTWTDMTDYPLASTFYFDPRFITSPTSPALILGCDSQAYTFDKTQLSETTSAASVADTEPLPEVQHP